MDFQSRQSHGHENKEGHNSNYSHLRGETGHGTSFSTPLKHFHSSSSENEGYEESPGKIVAVLDSVITISLAALFLGIPLFFTGLTLQGIIFEKQMYFYFWTLLAAVAWVSKSVIVGEMKIKRTPLEIPIILFWAFYGINIFFSVDRWHSFWGAFGDTSRGFMNITALVIAYFILVSHFNKKRLIIISWAMAISNLMLVLWFLLEISGIKMIAEKLGKFIPLSPIGSLTGLGIFLSAMLPVLVMLIFHLYSKNRSRLGRTGRIFLAALAFMAIIANLFSLMVLYEFVFWLAALVGVSFFLVYILAQIMRPNKNLSWVPMFVFVAILIILMIGGNSISRMQLPVEVNPSYSLSWNIAKNSLKDNLLMGSGPATYGYSFSMHRPQDFNINPYYNLRFSQGSGIFFEAVSTIGIIGTFFLILLSLTFLSVGLYLLSTNKKQNKIYSLGIFSSALIVFINSFAGKIEGSLIILGFLLVGLAIATLLHESEAEESNLTLSLKASPKYALALAFVFMVVSAGVVFLFVFLGKIYIADMRAGSSIKEAKITQEGSVKKMAEAINWNNRESRYYILLGQQLMALANEETKKGEDERKLDLIQGYITNSIAYANQAKVISPKDIITIEALAQIYENSGLYVSDSFALAEEHYKKAQELEPHNPIYPVKIGQIKLALASSKKNEDEAKALIREAADLFRGAIEEKENLAVAYYQLALCEEALENLDKAVENIDKAYFYENKNINYLFNSGRIRQNRGNEEDLKIAEAIYKEILQKNDKDANVHFSLGTLYEKTKKRNEASAEYKKILDIIPQENVEVRARIEKMIRNISRGIENTAENINLESESSPVETPETAEPSEAAESSVPIEPASPEIEATPAPIQTPGQKEPGQ